MSDEQEKLAGTAVFVPVKCPVLNSLGRTEVRLFLDEFTRYSALIERKNKDGQVLEQRSVTTCFTRELLERMIRFDFPGKKKEDISDGDVLEFLRKKRSVDGDCDIDQLFKTLSCDMTQRDCQERIQALFGQALNIHEQNGLSGKVTDKQLVKWIVSALQPVGLRKVIEKELEYANHAIKGDVDKVYVLVLERAKAFDLVHANRPESKPNAVPPKQHGSQHHGGNSGSATPRSGTKVPESSSKGAHEKQERHEGGVVAPQDSRPAPGGMLEVSGSALAERLSNSF